MPAVNQGSSYEYHCKCLEGHGRRIMHPYKTKSITDVTKKVQPQSRGPIIVSSLPPTPQRVWIHQQHDFASVSPNVKVPMVVPAYGPNECSPCHFYYPTSPMSNHDMCEYYHPSFPPTHQRLLPRQHQLRLNSSPQLIPQSNQVFESAQQPKTRCGYPQENVISNGLCRKKSKDSIRNELKVPLHGWRAKIPSPRYDSDDSGIAESPNSMTSTSTWKSCSDVDDSSMFQQKLSISECKDDNRNENNEKNETNANNELKGETFWSISNDEKYWGLLRRKPPSKHLISRIVAQVEYYLSDEYLLKDKYMLRQVRCKRDGYVSIKLITSFKKVKKITKDWATVRSAIVRRSSTLVVSPEGLRIKRKDELSENLRKPVLLTSVLVIRLPEDYNSVDRVTSLMSGFGEIEYVRLLRTDRNIPTDLKNYATQVPDIGQSLCAVVDFESGEDALSAVRTLKHFQKLVCWEDIENKEDEQTATIEKYTDILAGLPPLEDMRLALLGPRVRRTLYRQDRARSTEDEDSNASLDTYYHDNEASKAIEFEEETNVATLKPRRTIIQPRKPLSPNDVVVMRQPKGPTPNHKGFLITRSITK